MVRRQQAHPENASQEHGDSADDRDLTVMCLAATGLVYQVNGNCHGPQSGHRQESCEKTGRGGAELTHLVNPSL